MHSEVCWGWISNHVGGGDWLMPRLRLLLAPLLATALAAQDLSADVLEGERATLAESRIASSNFPTFVHNLNTGGNDERESKGTIATNSVRQERKSNRLNLRH